MERKEKGKKRIEINQDEREQTREEERRKILKELRKENMSLIVKQPPKPKDDKGKTIEKQPLKASMKEKTNSIKCFNCLGRGHITSECPTK